MPIDSTDSSRAAPSSWFEWKSLFMSRSRRAMPPLMAPKLTSIQRFQLARSLGVFHVGESGEGRIAADILRFDSKFINRAYQESIGLFVAEEARHGRILRQMVLSLNGRVPAKAWSESLFKMLRRMMGIRFKILVLMAAEVAGITFYSLISSKLEPGPFQVALTQICGDETDHLDFHADFFCSQIHKRHQELLFQVSWAAVWLASIMVVAADHRKTLEAFRISQAELWSCAAAYAAIPRRNVSRSLGPNLGNLHQAPKSWDQRTDQPSVTLRAN